jgi:peptidoglycan/xylan/chitin deacetylase (PgdA/CDA1 family)
MIIARRLVLRSIRRALADIGHMVLRLSGRRIGVVLVYHRVGGATRGPGQELTATPTAEAFGEQMRQAARLFEVVPPSAVLEATRRRRRGRRFPLALTFDDDLDSHAAVVAPILRELGLPAGFFVCGASLERPFSFWWEHLERAAGAGRDDEVAAVVLGPDSPVPGDESRPMIRRLAAVIEDMRPTARDAVSHRLAGSFARPDATPDGLRAHAVRALAADGFEVGFHTLRHDSLPPLDDSSLQEALERGRDQVAAAAGGPVTAIAYPHGKADARVAAKAAAAGYECGFGGERRFVHASDDPLLVPRLEPRLLTGHDFALWLLRKLAGADSPRGGSPL